MSTSKDLDSTQEKPRRLEDETATYLAEIEQQFNAIESDDIDTRSVLVQNVLSEIQSRTASAACDRRTNYLLEQLCSYADYSQILQLLQRWTVYSLFLARNRYASHVVQTIISRLCYFLKQGDMQDIDPTYMEQTILNFASPLVQEIHWLSKEMSASHVLRSLFCLLSGLPTIAERKGKNSKHQHSVLLAEPIDSLLIADGFCIDHQKAFSVPTSFKEELIRGIEKLFNRSRRDLQMLIADISSCACLTILLRILANVHLHANGPFLLSKFYETVLELPLHNLNHLQSENNQNQNMLDLVENLNINVIYGMAADKVGSYFLEHVLELLPWQAFHFVSLYTILPSLKDYYIHSFANFAFQALLRRLIKELQNWELTNSLTSAKAFSSNNNNTHGQQQEELLTLCETIFTTLFDQLTGLEIISQRFGVVGWLLQVSTQYASVASVTTGHKSVTLRTSSMIESPFLQLSHLLLYYWQSGHMNNMIPDTFEDVNLQGIEKKTSLEVMNQLESIEDTKVLIESQGISLDIGQITTNLAYFIAFHHQTTGISANNPDASATGGGKNKKKKKPHPESEGNEESNEKQPLQPKESQVLLLAKLISFGLTLTPYSNTSNNNTFLKQTLGQVITTFPVCIYTYLITSSNVCKLILDTFLTSFSYTNPGNTGFEIKSLSQQLILLGKPFALTYIGHFLVQKVYQEIDIRGKEKWLQVLLPTGNPGSNPLAAENLPTKGKKEYQSLLQSMRIELYLQNRNEWKQVMKKQQPQPQQPVVVTNKGANKKREREEEVVEEIVEVVAEAEGANVTSGAGKRKRKRKRPSSKANTTTANANDNEGNDNDNDGEEEEE